MNHVDKKSQSRYVREAPTRCKEELWQLPRELDISGSSFTLREDCRIHQRQYLCMKTSVSSSDAEGYVCTKI